MRIPLIALPPILLIGLLGLLATPVSATLIAHGDVLFLHGDQPVDISFDRLLANDEIPETAEPTVTLLSGPTELSIEAGADGSTHLDYKPGSRRYGLHRFTYRVEDGEGNTAQADGLIWLIPEWQPVSGYFPGAGAFVPGPCDTENKGRIGWYRDSDRTLELCRLEGLAFSDCNTFTAPAGSGTGPHLPLFGDWDDDGSDELGLYDLESSELQMLEIPADDVSNDSLVDAGRLQLDFGPSEVPLYGFRSQRKGNKLAAYDLLSGKLSTAGPIEVEFQSPSLVATPLSADWIDIGTHTLGLWDAALGELHFMVDFEGNGNGSWSLTESSDPENAGLPFTGPWGCDGETSFFGLYEPTGGMLELRILDDETRPTLHVIMPVDPGGGD